MLASSSAVLIPRMGEIIAKQGMNWFQMCAMMTSRSQCVRFHHKNELSDAVISRTSPAYIAYISTSLQPEQIDDRTMAHTMPDYKRYAVVFSVQCAERKI